MGHSHLPHPYSILPSFKCLCLHTGVFNLHRGLRPFQVTNSFCLKLPGMCFRKWGQQLGSWMTTSPSVAHTTAASSQALGAGPRSSVSRQRSKASVGNTLRSTAGHCRHHTHPHLLIQHCRNCFHLTLIAIHKANQSDAVGAGSFQHPPQILPSFPSTESIRCMGPH